MAAASRIYSRPPADPIPPRAEFSAVTPTPKIRVTGWKLRGPRIRSFSWLERPRLQLAPEPAPLRRLGGYLQRRSPQLQLKDLSSWGASPGGARPAPPDPLALSA